MEQLMLTSLRVFIDIIHTPLLITGKEISYEDLKNTLEKMPDRFVEHPNLLVTMTNVKFSELGLIESASKLIIKK